MWGKRLAALVAVLLLLAAAVPAGAAPRPVRGDVDALVYYGGGVTEQTLTVRLGITPRLRYDRFALARLTQAQLERLEQAGADVQLLRDKRRVELAGGFDTRRGDGLPGHLRASPPAGRGVYLVQFDGPVKQGWLRDLEALGAEVLGAVPHFTVIARMNPAQLRRAERLDSVVWTGYFQPGYKLSPALTDGEAVVEFFPGAPASREALGQAGAQVKALGRGRALVTGSRKALERMARLPEVAWIEPFTEPELLNATSRTVIRSDVAHSNGVRGTGQIVAVTDTGVYKAHEAFSETGKVVAVVDVAGDSASSGGDGHGHGTHVAGSVLGDAPTYDVYNSYDGQGFGARLVDVKVFNNAGSWAGGSDYYGFWNDAYGHGARVNSNSWGANTGGAYDASDRDADRITFDHKDYTLTIAAGNAGPGSNTVGSPASAKNAITVGATLTDTPENMASFSSRGPTDDGRIKPDVVAPGSYITSAQRGTTSGYTDMQGTSMATPQVGGAAAVVRQYFEDGYYPSGAAQSADAFSPSGALVKAVLINGAVEITGSGSDYAGEGVYPNNSQGWGRIDLDRSLYFWGDDRQILVWDEPAAPSTGSAWTGTFDVTDGSQEVKVTLTWTDPAAAAGASVAIVNDLHLRVTAPDGTVFLGNNFSGRNPGYSVSGGSFDARNTVEGVHLVPQYSFAGGLPTGTYTVEVIGSNVPTAGSNFAVVVGMGASSAPPPPELGEIAVMGDYSNQLTDLLTANGFTVTTYAGDDYAGVIGNLDSHAAVVLHQVSNASGFDNLLSQAAAKGRGLVFASSYPVGSHGMGVLSSRTGDPSATAQQWSDGPVQVTVEQSHPIFDGYAVGTTVTIINGGDNDYQTYSGYSGVTAGSSAMPRGYAGMIGYKDETATGGARHAVMGSFGASSWTNTAHWTADGKQIFLNAVAWAAGAETTPPPETTKLAIMGDYSNQIGDLLRSRGYDVDSYTSSDYSGVVANISQYDAVLLHRVSNDAGFDDLLAGAGEAGLIFLSSYPVGSHGMGVLSSRTGDPSATANHWGDGPVVIQIDDPSHPVFAGFSGSSITVINGGDNDYQTYSGFTGTTIGSSGMPRGYAGMVGVRDDRASGGNRQVILGSMGASSWTNVAHWTDAGKQLLINAVEWAKRP